MRILTWNVSFSSRTVGQYEKLSWAYRKASVIDILKKSDADIICLQEIHVDEKVNYIDDLQCLYHKYIVTKSKMNTDRGGENYIVSLFKRDKIKIIKHNTVNAGHKDIEAHSVTIIKYKHVDHSKNGANQRFVEYTIFNMHFPMKKTTRIDMAEKLLIDTTRPSIVCGDFNSFGNSGGLQQMKILKDKGLHESGLLINLDKKIVHETFKEYPYDSFKNKVLYPIDHILGKGVYFTEYICDNTNCFSFEDKLYGISDHYPLYATVIFNKK